MLAAGERAECLGALGLQDFVLHGNANRAAGRHRILRVHDERGDRALDLRPVGLDQPGGVREFEHEGMMGTEDAIHPPLQAHHDLPRIQRPGLQSLPSTEREQLTREFGGALGRDADLVECVGDRIRGPELIRGDVHPGEDAREHVVEVVGDPTREQPDCLHLLGLRDAHLQCVRLRHVGHRAQEGGSPFEVHHAARDVDFDQAPTRVPAAQVDPGRSRLAEGELRARATRGRDRTPVDQSHHLRPGGHRVGAESGELEESRIRVDDASRLDDHDPGERLLDEPAESIFGLAQRRLGPLACSDVARVHHEDGVPQHARIEAGGRGLEGPPLAVPVPRAEHQAADSGRVGLEGPEQLVQRGVVVGMREIAERAARELRWCPAEMH